MRQVLPCVCKLDTDLIGSGFPSHLDYFMSPSEAFDLQSHFLIPSSIIRIVAIGTSFNTTLPLALLVALKEQELV